VSVRPKERLRRLPLKASTRARVTLALHEQQVWDAVALKIDSMDDDERDELTGAIERADLDRLLREVDEDGDG
jgi:hypothetical protein